MSFALSSGRLLGAVALVLTVTASPATALAEAGPRAPGAVAASSSRSGPGKAALSPALKRELARVNEARAAHDRKPLRVSGCLTTKVAQPWAVHLADIQDLVHRDLDKVFEMCPGFSRLGENIAYGYATPAAVVRAWMHSPGHRKNLLNRRYKRIGLGLATTPDGTKYWVQNFGG
ncbi:MAG: CAP domain-containing protein [Nocardioidaceae bacterium]